MTRLAQEAADFNFARTAWIKLRSGQMCDGVGSKEALTACLAAYRGAQQYETYQCFVRALQASGGTLTSAQQLALDDWAGADTADYDPGTQFALGGLLAGRVAGFLGRLHGPKSLGTATLSLSDSTPLAPSLSWLSVSLDRVSAKLIQDAIDAGGGIRLNNAVGRVGEALTNESLVKAGLHRFASKVTVRFGETTSAIDNVINLNGQMFFLETKTGGASLREAQSIVFGALQRGEAVTQVGRNAAAVTGAYSTEVTGAVGIARWMVAY